MATIGEAIVIGSAAAAPVSSVYGAANMSGSKSFIKSYARLVVDNGEVHVAASFANAVFEKTKQATALIHAEVLNDNIHLLGRIIAVADLVHLLNVAYLDDDSPALQGGVEFRGADVITMAQFNASPAQGVLAAAQQIVGYLYSPAGAHHLDKTTADGFHYLQLVGMEYLHRERSAGHSCNMDSIMSEGSITHKCFDVGGSHKDELRRVAMKDSCGHDIYHFMTNCQLECIAEGMAGVVDFWIPAGTLVHGTALSSPARLADLLKLGDAFCDRVPDGMIGLSAIYIGLDCMLAVLHYMDIRVDRGYHRMRSAKIYVNLLLGHLDDGLGSRQELTNLKKTLMPIVAVFCGCASAMHEFKYLTESKPSIEKISKLYRAQFMQGKALKSGIESLAVKDHLVFNAIDDVMDSFAFAVRSMFAGAPFWNPGGIIM